MQPAPSRGVTLAARQGKARPGNSSLMQGLCQIRPLRRAGALPFWRCTRAFPSRACILTWLGCLVFPQEARLPACCALGFQAVVPCASWRSWLWVESPVLGLWVGAKTHRGRPKPPTHVSAGEKSAREPTSLRHLLGTHGLSLWAWAASHTQGPREPSALSAALSLCSQAPPGEAILSLFLSL